MRQAKVFVHDVPAGTLTELDHSKFSFDYIDEYAGPAVSLTMPISTKHYEFETFPPVFEGLLPEGPQLEILLRAHKIDRRDYYSQLLVVGKDLVGAVTVEAMS